MTMNDYEEEEEEMYLYLDFKGRLPPETFNSQVFFNITNLNTKHPLVQVGQSVFHGMSTFVYKDFMFNCGHLSLLHSKM